MMFDIAIIGTGGPIADALIRKFAANNISMVGFGRVPPQTIDLLGKFIAFDIEHPIERIQRTCAKTVLFNAGIKGRFEKGTGEHQRQKLISAPNLGNLLNVMNLRVSRLMTMGSSEEFGARDSSDEIFENSELKPISSYGTSKVALFESAKNWKGETGYPILHIRPYNVFGPGMDTQMFIGSLLTNILRGKAFNMTKGEQWRSFISISLFCRVFVDLVKMNSWTNINRNDSINLSSQNYLELREVVRIVQGLIPGAKVNLGAVPYRTFEVWHQNPNLDFVKKILGEDFFEDMKFQLQVAIDFYRKILIDAT